MPSDDKIKKIDDFLSRISKERIPNTIRLCRGQPEDKKLLPRLFRHGDPKRVTDIESKLLYRFKTRCPYLLPSQPNNEWDWLSLGQHFGLPTRLLDWTANPASALFFALDSDKVISPTVFIYHAYRAQIVEADAKKELNLFNLKETKIFRPVAHSTRVAMQAGWHTAHRIHAGKFVALDEMKDHLKHLAKISIEPSAVGNLREELGDMGVRHETIYGDLHNVCVAIAREFGL